MNTVQWHVLAAQTRPETQLSPTGAGLQDVEVVPYMVDSGPLAGTTRTITLPVGLYTPENVRNAIEQDVQNASAVGGLSS